MPTRYFFGFIISFISGVALESLANFDFPFSIFLGALAVVVFLVHSFIGGARESFLVSLVLFGCALGVLRVDVSQMKQNTQILDPWVNKVVRIEGVIDEEPDVRETYTDVVLEAQNVRDNTRSYVFERPARILVRVPAYPELHYGDRIMLVGKIALPKNLPPKKGMHTFDYRAYLAKDDIYYQMYFPKVFPIAYGEGNVVFEKLYAVKEILMRNITHAIPEPEAALGGGILLGTKQSLGTDLLQRFRETGIAHIVVLSGYNIAVVANVIARVVAFLPFVVRMIFGVLGIILFAMMVGGGATVVRATVMALVVIFARAIGREGDALRALMLAGFAMVVMNPHILLDDVSFQLSFTATLALITLAPTLEIYFQWVSSMLMREILVTTIATQILVLPILLYHMGSVSIVGVVTNLFVLPIIPFAMAMVALVAVFAWMPIVGGACAFLAYGALVYVFLVVELFSQIPFAFVQGISFPLWMLVTMYALIALFVLKKFPQERIKENSPYEF